MVGPAAHCGRPAAQCGRAAIDRLHSAVVQPWKPEHRVIVAVRSSMCILLYNIMLGRHTAWEVQERGKKKLNGLSYAQDQLHSAVVQQTTRLVAPLTAAGARCSDS